jgi:hypothetical protein
MLNIGISVEGQTEAMFCKYVLSRYLKKHNINLGEPVNLNGNINIHRVSNILSLMSNQYDYVTSLYDFYGFQDKKANENHLQLAQRISQHVVSIKNNVIPYVQQYEFETLLYCDINILCKHLYTNDIEMIKCREEFLLDIGNKKPEEINDSIQTAPSKRISHIFKKYKKSVYGYIIAQDIGIEVIKSNCPRFSSWLDSLILLSYKSEVIKQ